MWVTFCFGSDRARQTRRSGQRSRGALRIHRISLCVGLLAACLAMAGCPPKTNTVAVPDVAGQAQAAASGAIVGVGLTVGTVSEEYSATMASGTVISQSPAAGTKVSPGSVVSLIVSKGPQPVSVPDLAGKTQSAAKSAITRAGLAVGAVTKAYSDTVAVGLVISQDPAAGQSVPPGSAVAFVLSLGPLPPMTGTILINDDSTATNSPQVTLTLTWSGGGGTGVVRMRFSDDGSTWSGWEEPLSPRAYTLPGQDGAKTVRVQFMDQMQNRSAVFSDYIRLDTVAPTGAVVINGNATTTTSLAVTLGLTWSDGTGSGVTRMRFSDNGTTWTAWEAVAATRDYTLPDGLGYHTVRVQYTDAANNYSPVYNDYIKLVAP